MKILVVGDGHSSIHEVAVSRALVELGHQVESFYWSIFLESGHPLGRLWKKFQNKFLCGPAIATINRQVLRTCTSFQPQLVFIYRGTHLSASTIHAMRKAVPGVRIAGYNNDDPFAPGHPPRLWSIFKAAIPAYHLMFAYRHHNLAQFLAAGAKRVELLRSWFLPWANYPLVLNQEDHARFDCDIVFAGHYEDDGRTEMLEDLVRQGYKLRIFGPAKAWDSVLPRYPLLANLPPVRQVWGDDYNKALCGSKIALCFLSKLNRDTYTRRCFEIPATGTFMLSEYTDDLAGLFTPGVEADYFSKPAELLEKASFYLNNQDKRKAVAAAGLAKVHAAGHDILSRMEYVLATVKSL